MCLSIYVIRLTMERPFFVLWLVATMLLGATNGFRVQLVHRNSVFPTDLRAPLSELVDGAILANISFGKPPVPQLLVMDTGSEVTWIKCRPCGSRICTYDPTKSSTFTPLYENFSASYVDGLSATGTLALETVTFRTFEEDKMEEIEDSVFGCAETIENDDLDLETGMLGLGGDTESIFSQWKDFSTFSYCIGDLNDKDYKSSVLILGDGAIIQGDMIEMDSRYQVTLDGISIGGKAIGDQIYRQILIDSGTTLSHITEDLLSPLMAEVSAVLKGWRVRSYSKRLCYYGDISSIKNLNFPSIQFSLGGVAGIIEIEFEEAFTQTYYDSFCLAFVESRVDEEDNRPINVLGLLAQQNYNIGFDLKENTVSFDRMDCELLEG